jgi:hypothetical protein
MGQLWAVVGDPNSHGGGELTLSGDSSPGTVFINNIPVIVGTTDAGPDGLADPDGPPHDDPKSSSHSATVFAYNKPAHRNGDTRVCGATTVVVNETTVFVG